MTTELRFSSVFFRSASAWAKVESWIESGTWAMASEFTRLSLPLESRIVVETAPEDHQGYVMDEMFQLFIQFPAVLSVAEPMSPQRIWDDNGCESPDPPGQTRYAVPVQPEHARLQ